MQFHRGYITITMARRLWPGPGELVAWAGWRRGLEQDDRVGTLFGAAGRRKTHRRRSSTAVHDVWEGAPMRGVFR
jgi:hypothetical protein